MYGMGTTSSEAPSRVLVQATLASAPPVHPQLRLHGA